MIGEIKYNSKKQIKSFLLDKKKLILTPENNLNMYFNNKLPIINVKISHFFIKIPCSKFKGSKNKEEMQL
jgi:hypothetical protein